MHLMIVMITFSVVSPYFLKRIELLIQKSNPHWLKTFIADSFYVSCLLEFPKAYWHYEEPLALESVSFSSTETRSLFVAP